MVTGATGFVGRRLVELLVSSGWRVRALVLPEEAGSSGLAEEVEVVPGDITRANSLAGTMDHADVVFHLAALVDSWRPDPREFQRVNVGGTRNVITEVLRARIPRFVFTSSLSGIGVRPGEVLREDSPAGRAFGRYEESKAEAERVVWEAVQNEGLSAVVVIPSIILGPGDVRNAGKFLLSFVRGDFPGTFAEDSILPVVSVDDVARGLLLAYEQGAAGSRYIISGQNARWGDILQMASELSGTPVPSRRIGPLTLRLASRVWEFQSRVTRTPPKFPAWLADFMLTGAPMDASRSVRELGMSYTPIREAIRAAIEWYRKEGLFAAASGQPASGLAPLHAENPQPPRAPLAVENPSLSPGDASANEGGGSVAEGPLGKPRFHRRPPAP